MTPSGSPKPRTTGVRGVNNWYSRAGSSSTWAAMIELLIGRRQELTEADCDGQWAAPAPDAAVQRTSPVLGFSFQNRIQKSQHNRQRDENNPPVLYDSQGRAGNMLT